LWGEKKGGTVLIFIPALTANRVIYIPLTDASQGGYWFVDFRHARVFWASGTFAGGLGRVCRTERIPSPEKV
jgi:hypothetical protein